MPKDFATLWDSVLPACWAYLAVFAAAAVPALALVIRNPGIVRRLLPLAWLRRGEWSGAEVMFAFLTYAFIAPALVQLLFAGVGILRLVYDGDPDIKAALWTAPVSFVLTLALVLTLLYFAARTFPSDVGLSSRRWPANYLVGFIAFTLSTPLVLAIHAFMTLFFEEKEHFLEKLASAQNSIAEWGLFYFFAVINPAVLEELIFRGILLNWLRRASLQGQVLFIALVGSLAMAGAMSEQNIPFAIFAALLLAAHAYLVFRLQRQHLFQTLDDYWPGEPTSTEDEDEDEDEEEGEVLADEASSDDRPVSDRERQALAAWKAQDRLQQHHKRQLALFGSATFFALVHFNAWPAPIALFVLGWILGWLAQRTQNLLPCIVLHACFNSVAFLMLLFEVFK